MLDNGINPDGTFVLGAGAGFGNNAVASGSSIVGHSALFRAFDTNLFKLSATYLLINSATPPALGTPMDEPLNVPPSGTLHGSVYDGWKVLDSVGTTLATVASPGDVSYGFINFPNSTGVSNIAVTEYDVGFRSVQYGLFCPREQRCRVSCYRLGR